MFHCCFCPDSFDGLPEVTGRQLHSLVTQFDTSALLDFLEFQESVRKSQIKFVLGLVGDTSQVAGFLGYFTYVEPFTGVLSGEMHSIFVLPRFRALGLGRRLIFELENFSHKEKPAFLHATRVRNKGAFYNACGFRDYGIKVVKKII